jgi:CheY-like chemotaxis protein
VQFEFLATVSDALRRARQGRVHLWVLATDLPDMAGCELCGMLKSQDRRAAVYVIADEYSQAAERAARSARATLFECQVNLPAVLRQWLEHRAGQRCSTPDLRQSAAPHI